MTIQVSAQAEEARLAQHQQEKAAKLQHFQDEVRRRVKHLQNLKQQQQLHKSYKAVSSHCLSQGHDECV